MMPLDLDSLSILLSGLAYPDQRHAVHQRFLCGEPELEDPCHDGLLRSGEASEGLRVWIHHALPL